MRNTLSVIAGILFIVGFPPYIRAILRGETKPAKASWIIWAILDSIAFAGMYVKDAVNGQILGAVIGVWVIVFLAFKYGSPGWTKLDKFCLAGAATGIVLWVMFSNPVFGIVTSVTVIFIGSIPTFVNAWKNPGHDNRFAWTIFWLSCVFAVLAIPRFSWADVSQPVSFLLIESIMMYILYVHAQSFARK